MVSFIGSLLFIFVVKSHLTCFWYVIDTNLDHLTIRAYLTLVRA